MIGLSEAVTASNVIHFGCLPLHSSQPGRIDQYGECLRERGSVRSLSTVDRRRSRPGSDFHSSLGLLEAFSIRRIWHRCHDDQMYRRSWQVAPTSKGLSLSRSRWVVRCYLSQLCRPGSTNFSL